MHKLFLHIGAGKCGSTAIQHYMRCNIDELAEQGILIPSTELKSDGEAYGIQSWFFQSLLQSRPREAQKVVKKRLMALKDQMKKRNLHSVVISAENLGNPVGFEKFFEGCTELFDTKIIFYIRRQDDFMLSAWQQWGLKISATFDAWLSNDTWYPNKCLFGDWHRYLLPWEKMFGRERIVLRRYASNKLAGGDVVRDFLISCGFFMEDMPAEMQFLNKSYSDTVTRLAFDARDLFTGAHDNRLYEMFKRFGGESVYKNHRGSSLVSLGKRLQILKTYEEGNARLKNDYFNDEAGPLFDPPSERDIYDISDERITDEKITCLTRTLFGMYNHLLYLEQDNKDQS